MITEPPQHLMGWVDHPDRGLVAATLGPPLSQAAPHLMGADQDVFLYKAWKDVLGDYPKYIAQQIGDCFIAGTMVRMADQSERPIEDVRVGEVVLNHAGQPRGVMDVIRKPYAGSLVSFNTRGTDRDITCTPNHCFIGFPGGSIDLMSRHMDVCGTWMRAENIARDSARVLVSDRKLALPVKDVRQSSMASGEVFCLTVEGEHSFVANGYAVHNCTSFGSGHTCDLLQAIQIALGHKAEAWKEISTEAIYGMGREIANMLGGGDGCFGSAVAKAVMQGVVPREVVGEYSGQRAKQWGSRGTPADIKQKATEHRVKATAMVTTLEELDAALANAYPCIVCSNQGFTMTRDEDGVCQPHGSWAHCLSISGRRTKNGKRQYCIDQSWGENVPSGPRSDDQPSFSFWIDERPMASMLAGQDSFAFSAFDGFPGQPIPSHWTYAGFA